MDIARERRRTVRGLLAAAAFAAFAGISAGAGAPPESPLFPASAFLPGTSTTDAVLDAAVGPDGTVWVLNWSWSQERGQDITVRRVDPVTRATLSTAVLGGSSDDFGAAIEVDAAGHAYVAGTTRSADFPFTTGLAAGQPATTRPFVARMKADGSGFAWSHAFGSVGGGDWTSSMCLTADGDPVVVGQTFSGSFPVSTPFGRNHGTAGDVFVARVSADGTAVVFSTVLGGWDMDSAATACRAPGGGIVVAGSSYSVDFLARATVVMAPSQFAEGPQTFLAEIASSGASMTRLAAFGAAGIQHVAAGPDWLVLAGWADADDALPVGPPPANHGDQDFGLVLALDPTTWSPGLAIWTGTRDAQEFRSLAVGPDGTVWTASTANHANLPVPGAPRPHMAGDLDVYVAAFEPFGLSQVLGTYLGGSDADTAAAIVPAPGGGAWVLGQTFSADFPLVPPQSAPVPFGAAFVARILPGDPWTRPAAPAPATATMIDGHTVRVSWTGTDGQATSFAIDRSEYSLVRSGWTRTASVPFDASEWTDTSARPGHLYRYSVQAVNASGGSDASSTPPVATPATLRFDVRTGTVRSPWRRPGFRRDAVRLTGTVALDAGAAGTLDLPNEGLRLVANELEIDALLLSIPPGDGAWRIRRNGVRHWNRGRNSVDFEPSTGTLKVRLALRDSVAFVAQGPLPLRLVVGTDEGEADSIWRATRFGARTP